MGKAYFFGFWTWEELINWYLILPAYGQLLCLLAAFALISLLVALVYYIIKGVVYLIYYIFKAVIYVVAGVFYGIYKIFEAFYYLLTGKQRPKKQEKEPIKRENLVAKVKEKTPEVEPVVQYCSECGSRISETMAQQLAISGLAYCSICGKGYRTGFIEMES